MKRKSIIAMLLIVMMVFLTACSNQSNTPSGSTPSEENKIVQNMKPGSYTAEANGKNGPISVSVTVDETSILKVTVDSHSETEGISDSPIQRLPEAIVTGQTVAVDAITGATLTSTAIIEAVKAALIQAGANMDGFMKAAGGQSQSTEKVSLETDVVVVGGGGSGMSAAITARENGADVILLEKLTYLGGAAAISGGQVNGGGSEFQKNLGIEDSAEQIFMDIMKGGNFKNDARISWVFAQNVGQTFDWMINNIGIKYSEKPTPYGEHGVGRCFPAEGFAKEIARGLKEKVDATGVQVMFETPAKELIVENGTVTGVIAQDAAGKTYEIKTKSVILATGGFGANKEMLPENLASVLYYGPPGSTGDGHQMAKAVGGVFQLMENGKVNPQGVEYAPGLAKSTSIANRPVFDTTGAITINKAGKRVVNERGLLNDFGDAIEREESKTLFILMDKKGFDIFKRVNIENNIFSAEEFDQYIANNGSKAPILVKNDNLQEAAKAVGIDGEELAKTVERYNSFAASGKDADFGRLVTASLGEGPYYIIEQKLRFAITLGGVRISPNLEVVDAEDKAIPGLYAVGELVGGVHGDTSIPANNVGWAFTSGHMAGQIVTEKLK